MDWVDIATATIAILAIWYLIVERKWGAPCEGNTQAESTHQQW